MGGGADLIAPTEARQRSHEISTSHGASPRGGRAGKREKYPITKRQCREQQCAGNKKTKQKKGDATKNSNAGIHSGSADTDKTSQLTKPQVTNKSNTIAHAGANKDHNGLMRVA